MKKNYLVAGNWKMHLNIHEASVLTHRLSQHVHTYQDVEVVLAPSLMHLQAVSLEVDRRKFRLAAQNAFYKDSGAYTGEVSFSMLSHLVHYAIIGHSERRLYFGESNKIISNKVDAALRNNIVPILCVGETQIERRAGETRQVLHEQITSALSDLVSEDVEKMVIAYEPVWAISTFGGQLAKPSDVKQMIDFIRKQIAQLYGDKAAQAVRVLYGGSVDDQIARGYLEIDGCDGALVGGASLNHLKFAGIVNVAHALAREQHV